MKMNENKLKLAEQNLATFRARLATTANKDQVEAQIRAIKIQIKEIKSAGNS